MLASEVLAEQARQNTKAQFAASPNFDAELMGPSSWPSRRIR